MMVMTVILMLQAVVEEALHAKLPDGWVEREVPDDDGELVSEYTHAQYGLKQLEHPLDGYFESQVGVPECFPHVWDIPPSRSPIFQRPPPARNF